MIKLSLILPIYNMEALLPRCVSSIMANNFDNLEIILVNDGSTDHSLALCRQYEAEDSRVIVIDQEDMGLGLARNAGLKRATGDYVWFIDPDDEIPANAISTLISLAAAGDYDVVKGRHLRISGGEERVNSCRWTEGTVSRNGTAEERERWRRLKTEWTFGCAWAGIYKKQFLDRTGVIFDDSYKIFIEDGLFNAKLFANHPSCYLTEQVVYKYYDNPGSILNRGGSERADKLVLLLKVYSAYLNQINAYGENLDLLMVFIARYISWMAFDAASGGLKAIRRIINLFLDSGDVQNALHTSGSMKCLRRLDRPEDSLFYSVSMFLAKINARTLLALLIAVLSPFLGAYSGKNKRD